MREFEHHALSYILSKIELNNIITTDGATK